MQYMILRICNLSARSKPWKAFRRYDSEFLIAFYNALCFGVNRNGVRILEPLATR